LTESRRTMASFYTGTAAACEIAGGCTLRKYRQKSLPDSPWNRDRP
jgi:hypothetical protein